MPRRLVLFVASLFLAAPALAESSPRHGLAMHGDLKYAADFSHLGYVRPDAPKGGEVRLAAFGTAFDSFNPFIVRGNSADGIGRIYDTLLESTADEAFSEYGLLAETVETPPDRSWVQFRLRPNARFHDGRPVTADDVIFTFESLRTKGAPFYRAYYGNVAEVVRVADDTVKFVFHPGENRELPLILGQLPVLPKHFYEDRDFERGTLDPPLGSGPYRIESFEAGRRVTYRRVEDYWGKDLPLNRGRYNFDRIHYDYYRDDTVAIEAFKGGAFDFRFENSSKHWATAYDIPALRSGMLQREELPHDRPAGMQGFVYNTRRPIFADRKVREALAFAFDFEWSNRTLFYGQYTRTRSFFDNSELAATGLPSPAELALLEPHRERLPEEVFSRAYDPPSTDGTGNVRANLRRAVELLGEAGWQVDAKTRKLTHAESGLVMKFEILLVMPLFERIVLPFARNLERLGIDVDVRTVDSAQYQRRIQDFDFDMVVFTFPQSTSPGNEQRSFWGSDFADQAGSRNLIGIRDPVVDALIEGIIAAPNREALITATRALDRVLQWGHWVIPQWHVPYDRILFWDKFGRPDVTPARGVQFDAWWVDPERAERLEASRRRGSR